MRGHDTGITLTSRVLKLTKTEKKTRAKGWQNIQDGDEIVITQTIKSVTSYGRSNYQTAYWVENLRTGEKWGNTTTELINRISTNFKYTEV